MSWIPGWDSIESTTWWSAFYFWASIVALIGLGVTEVASHRYSERKDELSGIERAEKDRQHDQEMARVHLQASQANERAAELEKDAETARAKVADANARALEALAETNRAQARIAELQHTIADRIATPEQITIINDAVALNHQPVNRLAPAQPVDKEKTFPSFIIAALPGDKEVDNFVMSLRAIHYMNVVTLPDVYPLNAQSGVALYDPAGQDLNSLRS